MLSKNSTGKKYFHYWGKAQRRPEQLGADYHLLPYHCLDVAAVGKAVFSANKALTHDLASFLELTEDQLSNLFSFMLALHDLGKFSSAFQKLYSPNTDVLYSPVNCADYDGRNFRHDRMGLYFWKIIQDEVLTCLIGDEELGLQKMRIQDTLMILADCVLGHHGQPINKKDPKAIKAFVEEHNEQAAIEFLNDILTIFNPEIALEKLASKDWQQKLKQVSWHLAGVAVITDWIGSDSNFFHYQTEEIPLLDYWSIAQEAAQRALAVTDLWQPLNVQRFKSIQEHYGFQPTPLQHWAETVELDEFPQLFILEDVTGAGKTEAALALTHRLMAVGAAEGFYFGLPTMATSNAMFSRVAEHYQQMLTGNKGKKPSIVLAHGAREMNDLFNEAVLATGITDSDYHQADQTATAQCNHWLADSRKKALLAPVGVGTIDQALLAVLPRRHQSLRLLGLNRKVLIFDEVHAADEYMFELLESLLALHLHQGGSAILLTATLAKKQRQRLVNIWLTAGGLPKQDLQQEAFPLATKVALNQQQPLQEYPLASRADVSREVAVTLINSLDAGIETVLNAVAKGDCVVWVRNTVNDALDAYQLLKERMDKPEDCLLFHSRFVLQDRKEIETRVLAIFGKTSSNLERQGKVLIATQVFQESLDADADLMISDICPIDDLIQRAGRLHRHTRNSNRAYERNIKDVRPAPVLFVHAPEWDANPESDWLSKDFQSTEYVYRSPGRLWLGQRELLKLGAIRMPDEARQLIESVYSDSSYDQIPETLKHKEHELIGEQRSKAAKAKGGVLRWQQYGYSAASAMSWHEDNIDISTRHSDIETVEVVLLKQTKNNDLVFWVDDQRFELPLSTVKLSKNKYADKLAKIPPHLESALEELQKKYKYMQYLQVWLPEVDPVFTYDAVMGFSEK